MAAPWRRSSLRSVPISPMTTARCCKRREVIAGVFEVREQAGDSSTATSLGDDRTYRIRAIAGPASLAPMRPGCFMTARIVPVGDDWMFSGAQQLYAASERPAMLRLAAELATGHPRARTSTK